jgi:hypothetical protein
MGSDHAPVREQLTGVFEQDDAVTQQAPALLGVAGHDMRGLPIDGLCGRALRVVVTHDAPSGTWLLDIVSIDQRTAAAGRANYLYRHVFRLSHRRVPAVDGALIHR